MSVKGHNNLVEQNKLKHELQERFQEINKLSQKYSAEIRFQLNQKKSVKMTNKDIMDVYNKIYDFSELANSTGKMIKNNDKDNCENGLLKIYKDDLISFVDDMSNQLSKCYVQKDSILYTFNETYQNYKAFTNWLYKMYNYLDRFITQKTGVTLSSISLQTLKERYFNKFENNFEQTISEFINDFRQNNVPLPTSLKHMIELYEIFGAKSTTLKYNRELLRYEYIPDKPEETEKFYQDHFQLPFISKLEKYYQAEIDYKQKFSTPEYIQWSMEIIEKEQLMSEQCYPRSQQQIKNTLELLLIVKQAQKIVDSQTGLAYMIQSDRFNELNKLYLFLNRVKGQSMTALTKSFQDYFTQIGNAFNQSDFSQQKDSKTNVAEVYLNGILSLMDRAQMITRQYLGDDHEVQKAYNHAFGQVLNKNEKTPYWLAIYCDIILRTDKGQNENELNAKLRRIVSIFQLLYSRDVFFKNYQKFLSSRLLTISNHNLDLEKQILLKFRGEAGTSALAQLSAMINDIEQSQRFSKDIHLKEQFIYQTQVSLLSMGAWPINQQVNNIKTNQTFQNTIKFLEDNYIAFNQGRTVVWAYNYGQGEVTYKINNEKYFLILSTLQIIAFMLFNEKDEFTVNELMERTNITQIDLENSLIPFICLKILSRQERDLAEFQPNEIIKLSNTFQNKQKKLKVLPNQKMQPQRQQKQLEVDTLEQKQIWSQREHIVDSQLVRILKMRKTIKHNDLMDECQKLISIFKPDTIFIKKRIEGLLEKEYLKRDEKDLQFILLYYFLGICTFI